MTKQEKVKYWIDLSDRDLLVAGMLANWLKLNCFVKI